MVVTDLNKQYSSSSASSSISNFIKQELARNATIFTHADDNAPIRWFHKQSIEPKICLVTWGRILDKMHGICPCETPAGLIFDIG